MKKQTICYSSSLDALIAVAKRLSHHESAQKMDSEDFYDQYTRGNLPDEAVFVEWANDYQHYIELRRELEQRLRNAA